MTKVLILGMGPLLSDNVKMIGGQCLRTWHFTKPIIDAEHDCRLITIRIPDNTNPYPIDDSEKKIEKFSYKNFKYEEFNTSDHFFIINKLNDIIEDYQPDCIIAVNTFPSFIACSLNYSGAIWCDLNGWVLAEIQTKARLLNDDSQLNWGIEQERRIILRGDIFSTVSTPQSYALIGELALSGRLNKDTFDYSFATSIPNAVNENFIELDPMLDVRTYNIPEDAFIVLWSGGFNTWTDIEMLYGSLEYAIENNPQIHFVATGGTVDGHDDKTFNDFKNLILNSQYRDHFHLLGWIDFSEMIAWHKTANVGINIDSYNYETIFGARNRLINMIATGLPVITTLGTEISSIISQNNLGFTVAIGDEETFGKLILRLSNENEKLIVFGESARAFVIKEFSYEKTTRGLIKWLESPELAPDNKKIKYRLKENPKSLDASLNDIHRQGLILENYNSDQLIKAVGDLEAIRSKPIYKLAKKIKGFIKDK